MALFMLGHSIFRTGVAIKIAYLIGVLARYLGDMGVREVILMTTALTSAFLDNLSVIVAFTPVIDSLVASDISRVTYWTLLYGGTLGGNLTPIGSTANIVAIGLCDKAKIKIDWGYWLKLAVLPTLTQLLITSLWTFLM